MGLPSRISECWLTVICVWVSVCSVFKVLQSEDTSLTIISYTHAYIFTHRDCMLKLKADPSRLLRNSLVLHLLSSEFWSRSSLMTHTDVDTTDTDVWLVSFKTSRGIMMKLSVKNNSSAGKQTHVCLVGVETEPFKYVFVLAERARQSGNCRLLKVRSGENEHHSLWQVLGQILETETNRRGKRSDKIRLLGHRFRPLVWV